MDLFSGRIFVLGAGFSAGAGIPLTSSLLPEAAKLFSAEASGLFSRVNNYARQVDVDLEGNPDAIDFAKLCTHVEFIELREYAGGERWSSRGSREKMALHYYLSKAIAYATPAPADIPAYYLEFVKALTPNDVIVSFNWDLLFENICDQAGIEYSYTFDEGKIHLIKLHGSINWVSGEPKAMKAGRPSFEYEPIGLKDGFVEKEVYKSDLLKRLRFWKRTQFLIDEVQPMLVLPGYGKAFDIRLLATLWYRIEFLNVRDGGVSIIGMSVAEDDYFVESLFRFLFRGVFSKDRQIQLLNPDVEVFQRFSEFSMDNDLSFREACFDENSLNYALLH
ncbi:MAG: hypothetical protein P8L32_08055 [Paracoccaceae bacterium]|nr:hypothetical protein [Paracoccaceae bacterium]